MSWTKIDERESDERIEHESEDVREAKAKGVTVPVEGVEWRLQASEKPNAESMKMASGIVAEKPKKKVKLSSSSHDPVNSPSHYTSGGIETIDYMQAKLTPEEFIGYLKGNVIKYTSRAGKKIDMKEDYAKAQWYMNKLLKTLEEK